MSWVSLSIPEAGDAAADYMARTESDSIEKNLGVNVGPSVQLGAGGTAVAASVSAEGRVGMILDRDVNGPKIIPGKMPSPTDFLGHLLELDIDKVIDDVSEAVRTKTEYRTLSAGLTTRLEGQFGGGSRLNLQPGLYVKQTKATLKTRGLEVEDASAWERWAATGPIFRSVAASVDGEEATFGWSVSVGGGFFVRKELDLAVTASLASALYGDGVFEITPAVGIQGNF